jgi:2-oxoglutarate dehydrogenase E2 component (dihydrolipoamide succinyltransferase)
MTEIRVPTLGESVTEATIGRWFKKAGDAVAVDEPLVELETDKVTIEVPAPSAGTLGEIVAKDGECARRRPPTMPRAKSA